MKLTGKHWLLIAGILLMALGLYLSGTVHAVLAWIGGDPSTDQSITVIGILASVLAPWLIKLALGGSVE